MVRQIMLIEKQEQYDFSSEVPYQDQERNFRRNFVGAVNQALATLPEVTVQVNNSVDKAVIAFDIQCDWSRVEIPVPGTAVVATVTRANFSAGDAGVVMDVDQSPIGPMVIVQFFNNHGLKYAALQLNEFGREGEVYPVADEYGYDPGDYYDDDDYDNYPF